METAYIGLGANIPSAAGAPDQTLAAAALRLAELGRVSRRSSLYSTAPVGYADQPRFLNAVAALETDLDPHALLANLLRIEREFGRDRSAGLQNGPRTLDLDLLIYGNVVRDDPGLTLPHPRLAERAFVMVPLNEIAPQLVIVPGNATVQELLQTLHQRFPETPDAIVPLESDVWLPGSGPGTGANPRPNARHRNGSR